MPVAHNKAPTEPAGETLVPLARSGARSPRNAKRKRAHKKPLFSLSSKSCRRQREQIERYTKTWRRPICTQPQEPPWAARGLTGRYLSKWSRYFPAFTQVPNQKQTATRNPPDRCFSFSAFRQLSRAKQATTRCAGGEKRLYKKTHRSVTIKVFRPIAKER